MDSSLSKRRDKRFLVHLSMTVRQGMRSQDVLTENVSYRGLFVRTGVEAQLWELPPVLLGLGDRNIGLFGYTFAAGINY